jgi:hypothetical protein
MKHSEKLDQTFLQKIEFGDEPEDIYYCLIDKKISPDGLDVDKMRLTDPRNIDAQFREKGCLLMFTGDEIASLVNRGEFDASDLHRSLFDAAVRENIIRLK